MFRRPGALAGEILRAGLILTLLSCSAASNSGEASATLLRVRRCVGEVVPVCSSIRFTPSARVEHAEPGRRTISRRLGADDLQTLHRLVASADLTSHATDDRPVGSFVYVETAAVSRVFEDAAVPDSLRPLLAFVDRAGMRLFSRRYQPALPGE